MKASLGRPTGSLAERLIAKRFITDANCWEFTGSLNNKGYGQIGKGKSADGLILAHRASYLEFVGEIPVGLNVLHKCDNRKCFNPEHLFIGTQKENVFDMDKKNRRVNKYGMDSPSAKLTPEQVAAIRTRYIPGVNTSELAKEFNVSRQYIRDLANYLWRKNG